MWDLVCFMIQAASDRPKLYTRVVRSGPPAPLWLPSPHFPLPPKQIEFARGSNPTGATIEIRAEAIPAVSIWFYPADRALPVVRQAGSGSGQSVAPAQLRSLREAAFRALCR